MLTVSGGGQTDNEVKAGLISVPLAAGFTANPTSGTAPLTVQYTDTSSGNPTAWAWDFQNDGVTDSAVRDPSFTYDTAGTYTVMLTVSGGGQTDDEVKAGLISVALAAGFTANPTSGTAPLTVQYTDTSSGNPTAWAWDFDNDGVTDSTVRDPSFTYDTAGTYTVMLPVSGGGQTDDEVKAGLISVALAAGFTANPTSGTAPLTVDFTDTSTGVPTAWAWDFDNDGVTDSGLQNPSFTYETRGTFTVKLTVIRGGQTDEEVQTDLISVPKGKKKKARNVTLPSTASAKAINRVGPSPPATSTTTGLRTSL